MRHRRMVQGSLTFAGVAALGYAARITVTYIRFGRAPRHRPTSNGPQLLDQFLPVFDVADEQHITIHAPRPVVFQAATRADLMALWPVRAIFRIRELVLGAHPVRAQHSPALIPFLQSLGWQELASHPDTEIVMGSVTQPWEADVVFRPIAPDHFLAFQEPGFVKIAWNLRAEPHTGARTTLHTETRVLTTDPAARIKFRLYWACFSPGIVLIRFLILRQIKRQLERDAHCV